MPKITKFQLTVIAIGLIGFFIILSVYIIYFSSPSPTQSSELSQLERKAIIVDQLSLTYPNQTFTEDVTQILEEEGFTVDYISGEEVTVDFYRELPNKGYKIIILRAHSAIPLNGTPIVTLFTSEPYDANKYTFDQLSDGVVMAHYVDKDEEIYFGVTPKFIRMLGSKFNGAIVIHMGCDGLTYRDLGDAFIKKGAGAFISWSGPVTSQHSDTTSLNFIKHFVSERLTVERSITLTNAEIGPDPSFESRLNFYPTEADFIRI